MDIFLTGLYYYSIVAFIFWLILSMIAGYSGKTSNLTDAKDSLIWPISVAILIGLFIRIAVENYKKEK